jgi:hypothetical protein
MVDLLVPFINIQNHGRLALLSQEAQIARSQNTFGNWIRLTNGIATGIVHFAHITSYFGIAVIVVRNDVVGSAVPGLALGNTRWT